MTPGSHHAGLVEFIGSEIDLLVERWSMMKNMLDADADAFIFSLQNSIAIASSFEEYHEFPCNYGIFTRHVSQF